jgi:hypothetical protein
MYDGQSMIDDSDSGRPARGLALYDWDAKFDIRRHPELLVELVENMNVKPTHLGFGLPNGKKRHPRIYRTTDLPKVFSQFDNYEYISIETPIDGNFFNLKFGLGFTVSRGRHEYLAQKDAPLWSIS